MELPALKRQLSSVLKEEVQKPSIRRTKIVCTIGPASQDVSSLKQLMQAGMNVARLNFSHGDHKYHTQSIENIRKASAELKVTCGILLDNKGPEIRTGKLFNGGVINLVKGQTLELLCHENPDTFLGDTKRISVDYKNLPQVTNVGKIIKIDDGLLITTVLEKDEKAGVVKVRLENSGELGQRKGVNLPDTHVDLPPLTERDRQDLIFGAKNGVDFVAASFTRCADDVRHIREVLSSVEGGNQIQIIAKIENQSGLDNFDSILVEADGIMVARGDLGVEIPIQKVLHAQKMMIHKCNIAGKPVITATQMLESMVKNPRPTRAEATDVANAVFDGTDCVMLSGETAKGNYPVEAVEVMSRICKAAESAMDCRQFFDRIVKFTKRPLPRDESVASAAAKTSTDIQAGAIIVLSSSGGSARRVAKYCPAVPVITLTPHERTARQCLIVRGLHPFLIKLDKDVQPFTVGMELGKSLKWISTGQEVVLVKGVTGVVGTTNMIEVVTCS